MDHQILLAAVAVVAVPGFIVAGVWWMARQGKRGVAEQEARLARSRSARARVLQIGKSVAQVRNGTVIVKLRVEVMPDGADAYPVTTVWEVQQASLPQLQSPQGVAVKIDADDAQMIFPDVSWAEFSRIYWRAWVKGKQNDLK